MHMELFCVLTETRPVVIYSLPVNNTRSRTVKMELFAEKKHIANIFRFIHNKAAEKRSVDRLLIE